MYLWWKEANWTDWKIKNVRWTMIMEGKTKPESNLLKDQQVISIEVDWPK